MIKLAKLIQLQVITNCNRRLSKYIVVLLLSTFTTGQKFEHTNAVLDSEDIKKYEQESCIYAAKKTHQMT